MSNIVLYDYYDYCDGHLETNHPTPRDQTSEVPLGHHPARTEMASKESKNSCSCDVAGVMEAAAKHDASRGTETMTGNEEAPPLANLHCVANIHIHTDD